MCVSWVEVLLFLIVSTNLNIMLTFVRNGLINKDKFEANVFIFILNNISNSAFLGKDEGQRLVIFFLKMVLLLAVFVASLKIFVVENC